MEIYVRRDILNFQILQIRDHNAQILHDLNQTMSLINSRSLIDPPSIGLSKGRSGDEVNRIQNYLMKFGYIQHKEETILGAKIDKRRAISVPKIGEFDDNRKKL